MTDYSNAKERKALYYVCELCGQRVREEDVWSKRNSDPKGWNHAVCVRALGSQAPDPSIAELQQKRKDRDEKRAATQNGWVL